MKKILTIATSLLLAGGLVLSNSVTSFAAPKVDPYNTVQAELMFESSGVETARGIPGQVYVKGIDASDYFKVKDVDFYKGVGSMTVEVRTTSPAVMEVRKDSVDGERLATFRINDTKGEFESYTALMRGVDEGKNVLYFVGTYGTFDFDFWSCAEKKEMPPIPVTDPDPEPEPDPEPIVEPEPTPSVVNPYVVNEAEDADEAVAAVNLTQGDTGYSLVRAGGYVVAKNVDFTNGTDLIMVSAAADTASILEVRADSVDGELISSVKLSNTNGEFLNRIANAKSITGSHDLYFVAKKQTVKFDNWQFSKDPSYVQPEPEPEPEPIVVTGDLGLEYQINSWGTGYTVNFKVVNKGDAVNTWTLKLAKSDVTIDSSWCVNVASEGDYYVITPMSWNSNLGTGAGTDFGIQGSGSIGTTIGYTFE